MNKPYYAIIKDREQYDEYCDILEELTDSNTIEKEDEIELLSLLIQKFNEEQTEKHQLSLNPVELLLEIMVDNDISQIELARRINVSPQLVNDIAKYRREITKKVAIKLGSEFCIKHYSFLRPYNLKKAG